MQQLRQPRLAEIVAASLREDILTGRLKEGDSLPRQEHLFKDFRVSLPAVREAMRILETEGLVSVRRGNVGGAIVHLPTPERIAQMISMVLQYRRTTADDVSAALLHLEPVCAGLCAEREDRMETVLPPLREVIEVQEADFDNIGQYNETARRFHEAVVANCGNETMIVVIGALEAIWSAHESSVWREASDYDNPDSPMAIKTRRAALRDHQKLLTAIEGGNRSRAVSLASAHLTATRKTTLESSSNAVIKANLVGNRELPSTP